MLSLRVSEVKSPTLERAPGAAKGQWHNLESVPMRVAFGSGTIWSLLR